MSHFSESDAEKTSVIEYWIYFSHSGSQCSMDKEGSSNKQELHNFHAAVLKMLNVDSKQQMERIFITFTSVKK